ncbi:hypothetical protein DUI87_06912 [Hirundo rustica rustica]|uniref:Uncharacterized protein n=1 Tax=Hirundo rustica rustica TaxID=333673 RepID=A0A3M0KND0_HIRRU|nr:hypothetical protein DUI87_06912 [Hirundo rustica rustica]
MEEKHARITEYPELKGTHEDHRVRLLALHRATPRLALIPAWRETGHWYGQRLHLVVSQMASLLCSGETPPAELPPVLGSRHRKNKELLEQVQRRPPSCLDLFWISCLWTSLCDAFDIPLNVPVNDFSSQANKKHRRGIPLRGLGYLFYEEQSRGDPKFNEAVADECGEAVNADLLRKQQEGILSGYSEEGL